MRDVLDIILASDSRKYHHMQRQKSLLQYPTKKLLHNFSAIKEAGVRASNCTVQWQQE